MWDRCFYQGTSSDVPNISTTEVIPNPFAEGGRERDLTLACTRDVVWQRRNCCMRRLDF